MKFIKIYQTVLVFWMNGAHEEHEMEKGLMSVERLQI